MTSVAVQEIKPPERRRHIRIESGWKVAIGHADGWDLVGGTVRDVSQGGVCVVAPMDAAPGDDLLTILSLADETIAALVRVVRVEIAGPDTFRLHLQFRCVRESWRRSLAQVLPTPSIMASTGRPS